MSADHRHAVRGPFNAWFLGAIDGVMHRIYGERKLRLLGRVPPTVVEIGAGAGANFRYYPDGTKIVAVEPSVHMHERLRAAAARHGHELEIRGLRGEALDLETGSADLVVATLVLCTVDDPRAVLAEIRRILAPGGRYVFIEHVAAEAGSALRTLQNAVTRPWCWIFEGCHPNRDTAAALEGAGFASLALERFRVVSPFVPTIPQIAGVAVR